MPLYPRNCYCESYVQDRAAPLPPGHCGRCEACGEPGHTSHVPAPLPYTGSWCDTHYDLVAWAFDKERPPDGPRPRRAYRRIRIGKDPGKPDPSFFVEIERDMAFRVVLLNSDGLTRYEHGDITLGISVWTTPLESWEQESHPFDADHFEALWNEAGPPAPG